MRWSDIGRRAVILGSLAATAALAQDGPTTALEWKCWQEHTADRTRVSALESSRVDFGNLRNGFRVESPFLVEFSVKGMGIAPAGKEMSNKGHHHILVNTRLPLNPQHEIPFSDKHRHFGKGQTQTTLDLPPGSHTLRLLFADHKHRPYFVFSPEIKVEVTGRRSAVPPPLTSAGFDAQCDTWYQHLRTNPRPGDNHIYFTNVRDGERLRSPFNLKFGLSGQRYAGAHGVATPDSDYFQLDVMSGQRAVQSHDLTGGATELELDLPAGSYRLRLTLMPSHGNGPALHSAEASVTVQ